MSDTVRPTTPQSLEAGSAYLVLKRDGPNWSIVSAANARSSDAAIKTVVSKLSESNQSGVFVAVPMRSWTPVDVTIKATTTLHLEEAKT